MSGIKYRSNGIVADNISAVNYFKELGYKDIHRIIGDFRMQSEDTWFVGFDSYKKWMRTANNGSCMLEDKQEITLNDIYAKEYTLKLNSIRSGLVEYINHDIVGMSIRIVKNIADIDGGSIPKELIITLKDKI